MRAMTITAFGGPDVLKIQEVAEPEVRPKDLLIEVRAAALNPVDTKIRAGAHGNLPLPIIPGYDVCGTVIGMGDAAEGFALGDRIYASPNLRRPGSHAQRVAVDYRTAAPAPQSLTDAEAAALPLVTLTAWESLHDRARIGSCQSVLIHAGAGGVGHVAIQIAKAHGCRVITTASQPESIALCRELGADVVINYREENVVERVRAETGGAGVPVAFDTVGGAALDQAMDCLAIGGHVVGIVYTKTDTIYDKLFRINGTLHLEFMGVKPIHDIRPEDHGTILRSAAELADRGKLRPIVARTIGLTDLPAAHTEQAQSHTRGKIVIDPNR